MLLNVLQVGEAVLRRRARPLAIDEIRSPAIQQLIEDLRDTMREAPGVGLAAPQVGVSLQLAVIEDRAELMKDLAAERLDELGRQPVGFHAIVNPTITLGEETVEFFEGCLSLAKFGAVVARARRVTVECWNERAERVRIEADGWYARILQHEIDHLNGCLYIDRMQSRSFMTMDHFNRYWKNLPMAEIRKALLDEGG
ncbi:MAG: peptide deformylase [Acidobacteriia bacterium]|nr:peptide deformylase [Terriglobia bacterium]